MDKYDRYWNSLPLPPPYRYLPLPLVQSYPRPHPALSSSRKKQAVVARSSPEVHPFKAMAQRDEWSQTSYYGFILQIHDQGLVSDGLSLWKKNLRKRKEKELKKRKDKPTWNISKLSPKEWLFSCVKRPSQVLDAYIFLLHSNGTFILWCDVKAGFGPATSYATFFSARAK